MKRYLQLYPTALTQEVAERLFVKKYQSALHYQTFAIDGIVSHRRFDLPPKCLRDTLDELLEWVLDEHTDIVNGRDHNAVWEWCESNMDFDGTDDTN